MPIIRIQITEKEITNCPREYPYVFDNGVKCCKTDRDGHGHPLTRKSKTCALNRFTTCPGTKEFTICNNYLGIELLFITFY